MKQLASVIVTVLITIAIILIVWQLRTIVFLFLFSILLAAALREPIEQLVRRNWPMWAAMMTVYAIMFLVLVGMVILLSFPVADEAEQLTTVLVQKYEVGYGFFQTDRFAENRFTNRLPPAELVRQFFIGDQESNLASHLLLFVQSFAWWIGQIFLALVVSVYWSADEWHFERLFLSILPSAHRIRLRDLWRQVERNVGAYLRSELFQTLFVGFLLTVGFWAAGMSYPFTMATIGAIAWFIPIVGVLLALPLIALIVFVEGSLLMVGIAVGYTLAAYALLRWVIAPRLFQRENQGMLPVIIIMMSMVELYGLIGLLIAPPLALVLQIVFDGWAQVSAPAKQKTDVPTEETVSIQEISTQLETVRQSITDREGSSPHMQSVAKRLEKLLDKTINAETHPGNATASLSAEEQISLT